MGTADELRDLAVEASRLADELERAAKAAAQLPTLGEIEDLEESMRCVADAAGGMIDA